MNIKQQTSTIRSYGTPSIFSGTNLWTIKEENNTKYWYFQDEYKGPEATGNFLPNYNSTLFTGKGSFQKNLDLLNSRINAIHKELSYWDLYRITDTILTAESFPSVISGLAVGNSAVINCDTFTYNNQRYHRGDVIVKINDSEELWIKAVNAGSFIPVEFFKDPNNGLYSLRFEYLEGPGVATTVSGLQIASEGNSIYGYSYEMDMIGSERFPIEYLGTGTSPIKPVVKTFILENYGYEEIVLDNDLIISTASGDWVLNLIEKPNKKIYMQVK